MPLSSATCANILPLTPWLILANHQPPNQPHFVKCAETSEPSCPTLPQGGLRNMCGHPPPTYPSLQNVRKPANHPNRPPLRTVFVKCADTSLLTPALIPTNHHQPTRPCKMCGKQTTSVPDPMRAVFVTCTDTSLFTLGLIPTDRPPPTYPSLQNVRKLAHQPTRP